MESKLLSKFFTSFVVLYLLFILISVISVTTGFDNYLSLTEKFWKNPETGKEYYYALGLPKKNQTLYAKINNNQGEVQAAGNIISNTWNTLKAGVKAFQAYQECMNGSNSQTTTNCFVTNLLQIPLQSSIGCISTDIQQNADSITINPDGSVSGGGCGNSGAIKVLENFDPNAEVGQTANAENNTWGGVLVITENVGSRLYTETGNMVSFKNYAKNELAQIPLIGTKTTQAAWWGVTLNKVSLGEAFFKLWKSSRNISYYLIIIPTIFLGFAIMFRAQINPQTQITLLNIIPRLLIVMLLITFSYPIAAIMVKLAEPIADIVIKIIWDTVFSVPTNFFNIGSTAVFAGLGGILLAVIGSLGSLALVGGVLIGGIGIFILLLVVIWVVAFIISAIRYLIGVAILTIKIGLLIGFGPLVILVSAFPGREPLLKNYFMTLVSNIFGLSLMSILWSLNLALMLLGLNLGTLAFLAMSIMAIGIVWKSPSAPKMLAGMLGVQPLFATGQQRR